ncbi:MAG: DUF4403 family protein, partial [Verrucomicrobiales bacterium]|nr:DUF4403 family protein [Verrucomicrobiales bacterium]
MQGVARVSGQVDAQIVSFPIDSTANLGGHIHGTVTPQINQDWQLIPNLDPYLNLTQADVTLGRIGTISARDIIEKAAEPLIRKELAGLSQSIDLKEHIRKVWDQLHLNQQVNDDPPVFAVVDPYAISLAPIDYSNAYNLSVTLSMEANTYLSSHPGDGIYPEPLPGLKLIPYNPANLLQIPVVVDVEMLNGKMADQSFSEAGSNGSAISVNEFELRIGQDGYVILGCYLIANSGGKVDKTISGRIWVQAKPQLDATNQLLTFSSIELTKETRAAIPKTARIMLESQLVASLTKQLKIDLKKYMPDLESELQKKITTQEVPEGIDLIVGKPTIKLLRIYTVT